MSRRALFESIYARHAPAVKAYALRRTDASAADDVVADVFTVCWRRLDDAPEEPLPWLLGIARRALSARRRSESRLKGLRELLARESVPEAEPPWIGVGSIGLALAQMRASDRELLLLVAWEGLTPSEAATVMGIGAGAARVRLHRARGRLAVALAAAGDERSNLTTSSPEVSP